MARELPIRNGRLTTDLDADWHKIKNLPPGEGFTQAQADWNQTDATAPDFIKNKPTIPAPVTVDSALSPTSTNPVQNKVVTEALDARPTKAQIDAGWWSEWAITPDVGLLRYVDSQWKWGVYIGDEFYATMSVGGNLDSTSLSWEDSVGGVATQYTATRHRVAAPVPTRPEDIGAQPAGSYATAAQGGKADAALSRAEAEAGFTEWVFIPATFEGKVCSVAYEDNKWYLYLDGSMTEQTDSSPEDATSLSFMDGSVTATRTRLPKMADIPTKTSDLTNDSGFLTSHQDISGKADKSEMSVTPGTGANADKTNIQLKSGTSAKVLTEHQSLAGLMPMYPMVTATVASGTLTVAPYTLATYTADSTAAAFEIAVGALPAGVSGKARDCILVIDCTATGAVAPTVTWGAHFHPRTDTATDLAIVEAGKRAVFYISEYAAGEFAVGGWQETVGGSGT